ncbi:unnamed protein product [Caenorhabditis angaria]|uniref:C2H2-type domain-containing protein n=1 Tax=Caenorhabditis angaria TaxID=860376 RepID=A0A9P1N8K6_9PELO|nr:unnamed protein product [Caenorhabditis angaria]
MASPNRKRQKCVKSLTEIFKEFEEKVNEHEKHFPELKFYSNDARILSATCPTESSSTNSGIVDDDCVSNDFGYVIAVKKNSGRFECNTCTKIEKSFEAIKEHHKNVHVGEYKTQTQRKQRSAKMSRNNGFQKMDSSPEK